MRCLVAALIIASCAFGQRIVWDFETGVGKWLAWGTKAGLDAQKASRIIGVEKSNPHGGLQCLAVRDEFDNASPYAIVKVAVDPAKSYVVKGYIRADAERTAHDWIGVSATASGDKFIRWLPTSRFDISSEWKAFTVVISGLPAETAELNIAVRPSLYSPQTSTGVVYVDDVEFYEQGSAPIDMKDACNRGFSDEIEGDNAGGWTDQGKNDLSGMKTGVLTVQDVPFTVIDPAKNGGKSALVLRASGGFFAQKGEVACGKSADWIYLLHAAAWASGGGAVGVMTIAYEDGTSADVKMTSGNELGDWWGGNAKGSYGVKLEGVNPMKSPVYLFAASIANPQPSKQIKSLVFRSGADAGKAIWMIVAVTLGSGANLIDMGKIGAVNRDYSKWFPFPLNPKKQMKPLVDLSSLLHTPAGKHGMVQAKNGHFFFADGKEARFWAVNIHSANALFPSHDQAERVAETLARNGINLVRFHLTEYVLIDRTRSDRSTFIADTDEKWDRFDYFVKCFKDKGIYMLLDSVTGLSARGVTDADAPNGSQYGAHRPWAHFEPAFSKLGKTYIKGLLTHVNKYTGKALKDEPAIAMLMLINEQTMFFDWNTAAWPDHYKDLLKKKFNEFLLAEHGSRDALAKAWTQNGVCGLLVGEDPAKGTVEPSTVWELTSEGDMNTEKSPVRIRATIAFFKSVQIAWQKEMVDYIRSLGCALPIADSNIYYDIADLDTQRDMDYTSQNVYYDHVRLNKDGSHSMENIPVVERNPLLGIGLIDSAIAMVKINTHPVTSTESDMMWPHEWRSTYFLNTSTAASLQDWDAIYFYCYFGGFGYDWDKADSATAVMQPTVEFNDPALLATMPNASLMYHRRDVQPAKNLVQVVYTEADKLIYRGDPRNGGFPFNYLPYVSRVEGAFGRPDGRQQATISSSEKGDFRFSRTENTKSPLDCARELDLFLKKKGLVPEDRGIQRDSLVSDTGEVIRDFGKGLLMVNTPRTQGFSGFPKDAVTLTDIEITSRTPFTTILVSSLENAPISSAKRMLLTVIARAENDKDKMQYSGFSKAPNGVTRGERLINTRERPGNGTVRVEPTDATVRFKSGGTLTITPLAPDMSALAASVKADAVETAKFPTVWYLVERK